MRLYSLPDERRKRGLRAIKILISALLFLLLCEWIVYKVPFWKIYLPASTWSDEAVYTKLLEAVVNFGAPQGYFGYNESHAEIGRYSAWGPIGTWIYAVPGFFLRGNNSVLLCNIFFILVGWLAFSYMAHLSVAQQLLFGTILALLSVPIRYIFSAMQEPLYYALMLAVIGIGSYIRKKGSKVAWFVLCVLCILSTWARPYNIALWIYPFALAWPKQMKCLACLGGMSLSLASALALMDKMNAPYFFTTVDLGLFDLLARMDISAAGQYVVEKLSTAFQVIVQDIQNAVAGNGGGCYLVFLLLLVGTGVCFVWDWYHKKLCFWKGCSLSFSLTVFGALVLMYPSQVARHMLILDLMMLATLVYENLRMAIGLAVGIGVLTVVGMIELAPLDTYAIPSYNENMAQEIVLLQNVLQESEASDNRNNPWDHTLAYSLELGSYTGILYAVPEGMGIQFDTEDYLSCMTNEIYSRYIMTISDGLVERRLIDEGWSLLYEGGKCVVYKRT